MTSSNCSFVSLALICTLILDLSRATIGKTIGTTKMLFS